MALQTQTQNTGGRAVKNEEKATVAASGGYVSDAAVHEGAVSAPLNLKEAIQRARKLLALESTHRAHSGGCRCGRCDNGD
jgi:hypothetical protein